MISIDIYGSDVEDPWYFYIITMNLFFFAERDMVPRNDRLMILRPPLVENEFGNSTRPTVRWLQ